MTNDERRRLSRRHLVGAGSLALGTALAGCVDSLSSSGSGSGSDPPPVDAVEARIQDVRQPNVGATSVTLPILVELHNPTSDAIPNPGLEADLSVLDEQVATADTSLNTLDPGEEAIASLDAVVQFAELSRSLADAIRSGEFALQLDGELSSEGASTPVSLSYSV